MYVCVCAKVNEQTIIECIEDGIPFEDMCRETLAGTGCGICREYIDQLYDLYSDSESKPRSNTSVRS